MTGIDRCSLPSRAKCPESNEDEKDCIACGEFLDSDEVCWESSCELLGQDQPVYCKHCGESITKEDIETEYCALCQKKIKL